MNNSYKMRVDDRLWPVRGERLMTVAISIIAIISLLSLLKARKVTLVRTMPCFNIGRSINVY